MGCCRCNETAPRPAQASAIDAGDRIDRQLAVDSPERFEIKAILRTIGETLETDDAAQRGEASGLSTGFEFNGARGHRLEIERRQTAAEEIDDAMATVDAEVLGSPDVGGLELKPPITT